MITLNTTRIAYSLKDVPKGVVACVAFGRKVRYNFPLSTDEVGLRDYMGCVTYIAENMAWTALKYGQVGDQHRCRAMASHAQPALNSCPEGCRRRIFGE